MRTMYARPRRPRGRLLPQLGVVALVVVVGSSGAVVTDAFGAGEVWQKVLDRHGGRDATPDDNADNSGFDRPGCIGDADATPDAGSRPGGFPDRS